MDALIANLIWIIPLLPLTAFLINGLFGRWLKEMGGWIAFMMMGTAAGISMWAAWQGFHHQVHYPLETGPIWEWLTIGDLSINVGFHYDQLTAIMLCVVTTVGSLVFLYSIGYMADDPGFNRFFAYLSLFAFSMLLLVLGDSFPLMFVGWEGVGLCSYLLIGYYLEMPGAPEAGKKAFIVNRIGDAGFLLGVFIIFQMTGTLNIADAMEKSPAAFAAGGTLVTMATLLLFLGCTGKSAQIPLFIWLPDAMAGPTPVSALIHAATMVTAGVYLMARTSVLFALAPVTLEVVAIIGALTAFVAGTIALTQRDIKKVLAYSTVSQLGYMFLACGVGAFSAGIFHVVTHAFFKACLFLGAGAVIHALHGQQDLFMMGGLRKRIPTVWITYLVACIAIAGVPPLSGFFSKDEILWKTYSTGHFFLYPLALVTAFMTVCYSFRSLYLAFHGKSRTPETQLHHLHAPGATMRVTLLILAIGSVFVGLLNIPHVLAHLFDIGEGATFEHFLHPVLAQADEIITAQGNGQIIHSAGLELTLMSLSIALALFGLWFARRIFLHSWPGSAMRIAERFPVAYQFSRDRWFWDDASKFVFAGGARVLAVVSTTFDKLIIDGVLHGTGKIALEIGRGIRRVQNGQLQTAALGLLIGANILILVVLFW